MGLHICIQTKEGVEHPDWDFCRQGDDQDNVKLLSADCEHWHSGKPVWEDDLFLMRPTRTTELIGDRGAEMMCILADPVWWVYVSH